MQNWLHNFHQLDLQTRQSDWTYSFFVIWIINKSILFNKSDDRLWELVSDRKLKKISFPISNKLFATSLVEQARDRNQTLLNIRVMQVLGKIYEGDIS